PDLDVNEYLNQTKEHEENIENQPDINYENDYDTSVMPINPGSETPISSKAMVYQATCRFNSNHEKVTPENIEKRSRTFEQRLSQVAERMKDRRQKWLESQEKKRWWKVW
ncbi:MAG: hypothetical protein GX336_07630, partial [Halanaerobiaceae bacterium]|nr:hypothetical protein [Halanaerobiaceae bacterium]